MSNAEIIDNHDLSFDPGDPRNGSLYLCRERHQSRTLHCDAIIEKMRACELWSSDGVKEVPDEHRDAYKQQLTFVEQVSYEVADSTILIARFDHEKFPSDPARWEQWKAHLDAEFTRV